MKNLLCLLFVFLLVSCGKEQIQDVGTQKDTYFHIRNVDGSVATQVEPELMNPIYEHMISLGMTAEAEKFLVTYTEEGTLIPQISELNFEGRSTVGAQSNSPVDPNYQSLEQPITNTELEASDRTGFNYGGHNQGIGWRYGFDIDVDTDPFFYELGTTGQSRRLEAYYLILYNYGLCYQSHIQNIGWQGTKCSGEITGTTGQSKRMEATRIWLNGGPTPGFVGYQAHIQNIGWQPWVFNGAQAGTTGQSLRLEAFRVKFYLF